MSDRSSVGALIILGVAASLLASFHIIAWTSSNLGLCGIVGLLALAAVSISLEDRGEV